MEGEGRVGVTKYYLIFGCGRLPICLTSLSSALNTKPKAPAGCVETPRAFSILKMFWGVTGQKSTNYKPEIDSVQQVRFNFQKQTFSFVGVCRVGVLLGIMLRVLYCCRMVMCDLCVSVWACLWFVCFGVKGHQKNSYRFQKNKQCLNFKVVQIPRSHQMHTQKKQVF